MTPATAQTGTMRKDPNLTFPQQLHCYKRKHFLWYLMRPGLSGQVTPPGVTVQGVRLHTMGLNGWWRLTECPRHRRFQLLVNCVV